jgi:hypothetical protein
VHNRRRKGTLPVLGSSLSGRPAGEPERWKPADAWPSPPRCGCGPAMTWRCVIRPGWCPGPSICVTAATWTWSAPRSTASPTWPRSVGWVPRPECPEAGIRCLGSVCSSGWSAGRPHARPLRGPGGSSPLLCPRQRRPLVAFQRQNHPPGAADNVAGFITRRAAADGLLDFYGTGRSFSLGIEGSTEPIPASAIVIADLSGWRYRPRRHQVAVDPRLGRIAFGTRHTPRRGVGCTTARSLTSWCRWRRPGRRPAGRACTVGRGVGSPP